MNTRERFSSSQYGRAQYHALRIKTEARIVTRACVGSLAWFEGIPDPLVREWCDIVITALPADLVRS